MRWVGCACIGSSCSPLGGIPVGTAGFARAVLIQSSAPGTWPVVLSSPAARGAFQMGILGNLGKKIIRHTACILPSVLLSCFFL